jgi:nucleoside-diphosphate-sugar epimerase
MKVIITGSSGACGSALTTLPYDNVFFDLNRTPDASENGTFIQGDFHDLDTFRMAMDGCNVLVHLAASDYYPDFQMGLDEAWDGYLKNNITGVKNVFDAAVESGIEKIIFASTHRVMGMYERQYAPSIYELGHNVMIDHLAPVRPDSDYALSKIFGETLGRLLVDQGKMKFVSLRICSVRSADADHPYAYAEYGVQQKRWTRDSKKYKQQVNRLKGLWQSRRDFLQMVDLCIQCDSIDYDIFYGLSDNSRRWFDIEHAKSVLGYSPKDNSENFSKIPVEFIKDFQ